MEPQQPTNPITDDDDDVEGHRRTIAVEGGQDDTDDVEGHLTGALGSKTDHER
jgi:hypothetical protein